MLLSVLQASAGAAQVDTASAIRVIETPLPAFHFAAPARYDDYVERLRTSDPQRLRRMVRALDLQDDVGPPIRVTLAGEDTPEAKRVPRHVLGYAFGAAGSIVLLPARVDRNTLDDLETVFVHEVAHVLVARAAGRKPVPLWLNEGLAVLLSRGLRFQDHGRLLLLAFGPRPPMAEIEAGFHGEPRAAETAYALAAVRVDDLMSQFGDGAPARILRKLADGTPFELALWQVTGEHPVAAEARFWRQLRLSHLWLPLLTGSTSLWVGMAALFLLATFRRRQRDDDIRDRWAAQEEAEQAERDAQMRALLDAQRRASAPPSEHGDDDPPLRMPPSTSTLSHWRPRPDETIH
ncbi:MAG: hypothetical protein AAF772_02505 [Acidobacteriota bacterium]